jgi:hypothetical protein
VCGEQTRALAATAGSNNAIRTAMIAITTSNSGRVFKRNVKTTNWIFEEPAIERMAPDCAKILRSPNEFDYQGNSSTERLSANSPDSCGLHNWASAVYLLRAARA